MDEENKNIFEIIDTFCDKVADTIIFYDTEGIQHVFVKACLELAVYGVIIWGAYKLGSTLWSLL